MSPVIESGSSRPIKVRFFISTYSGAEYVKFRKRASWGKMGTTAPSASVWVGLDKKIWPNLISYRLWKQNYMFDFR
jgi:hypothetical protein